MDFHFLVFLYIVLGSVAGFTAGLLGIGGGIILVPLFLFIFPLLGYSTDVVAHAAFATSLSIIVPTAISSTFGHRKRGNVAWHQVLFLAIGGTAGALIGSTLAAQISGQTLKLLFGVMQIVVAGKMILSQKTSLHSTREKHPAAAFVTIGIIGGTFSSFFGVGGGVIAVPLMVMILRLPMHLSVGNSSALIVVSALFGAISYILHGWGLDGLPPYTVGYVNWLATVLIAPFAMIFARLGVRIASQISHAKLLRVFAVLMILVGVRMIVEFYLR